MILKDLLTNFWRVAGEDAEEGGFAFFGLGDGGADEFAEFAEEVFAEVGQGAVFQNKNTGSEWSLRSYATQIEGLEDGRYNPSGCRIRRRPS